MIDKARGLFEGTEHMDARVTRAKALHDKWEAEIEAERAAYDALYWELSTKADAAWPAIASAIAAEDGFDPSMSDWRGKTVRINRLRNRIRWDFSGPLDFAIWVNGVPVVGNFEPRVREAFYAAEEQTKSSIDDHTDWDAIIVVGGPGQVKQRFTKTVKVTVAGKLEEARVEEWLPVNCVMCKVIALHAGPVAVGPE
jgi:hypothetical protein